MARDHDRHTVHVTYRTARMADRDADRLRSCGWLVRQGAAGSKVLEVETYKPESLFGEYGAPALVRRPLDGAAYREADNWRHGIVSWEFACECQPWRLHSDERCKGIEAELQPVGADGKIFFPPATYVIERVSWGCTWRGERAQVAVRVPGEDSWRGRMIMVAESQIVALIPGLTSAQRQCYIETGDIPAVEDTYPVEGLA